MEYRNWCFDFPRRAMEVIRGTTEEPSVLGVTRDLLALYPMILMPFERLDEGRQGGDKDRDVPQLRSCIKAYDELKDTKFNDLVSGDWWHAKDKCRKFRTTFRMDNESFRLRPDKKYAEVEKILRHSMAHGNIWCNSGTIRYLAFANFKCPSPVQWLVLSTKSLRDLVHKPQCEINNLYNISQGADMDSYAATNPASESTENG